MRLSLLAAIVLATPLAAQQPVRPAQPGDRPGMQQRVAAPPMAPARSPAERLLRLRSQLALTDDQVNRLQSLSTSQEQALTPQRPAMLRARADLMEAMQKDNLDAAHTAMERMARLRTDAAFARLKADKEARDILTADQKSKLQGFRAMQRQRMRGMAMRRRGMGGGMGPGMGGGMAPGMPGGRMPMPGMRGRMPMAPQQP